MGHEQSGSAKELVRSSMAIWNHVCYTQQLCSHEKRTETYRVKKYSKLNESSLSLSVDG